MADRLSRASAGAAQTSLNALDNVNCFSSASRQDVLAFGRDGDDWAGGILKHLEKDAGNGAHFMKHSPGTGFSQQFRRSMSGQQVGYPNGGPQHSSMFHSNVDMLDAYIRGTGAYVPGTILPFNIDMGQSIGAGFQRNGGPFVHTEEAFFVFRNGSPYTFFPNIKP